MATVLVVDDEADLRYLVSATLRVHRSPRFEVIGTASDGHDAIAQWRAGRPDVVVLDHRMPDLNGVEVARRILAEDPAQCIVLFSAHVTADLMEEARRVGVRQCVSKDDVFRLPGVLAEVCSD